MGQSVSEENSHRLSKTVTNDALSELFARACARQFQPIELVYIRNNMKAFDKDQNQEISELELQEMLQVPEETPKATHLIFTIAKRLSQFPLIASDSQPVNFQGLLKTITLVSRNRYSRLLSKEYDYLKLIFLVFAAKSSIKSKESYESQLQNDTQTVVYRAQNIISWLDTPVVENTHGLDLRSLYITASDALDLITLLLVIARLEPQECLKTYAQNFKKWDSYKLQALPILRSMKKDIILPNVTTESINFEQFTNGITYFAPNLLDPLSSLFEHLLFQISVPTAHDKETEAKQASDDTTKVKELHTTSRLINEFSLAQLSTFLRSELVYSNIRKLYIGSDSGFSMRSFESKVFKWNAPTILLLKGSRINANSTNPRYKKFEEDFPRYKGTQSQLSQDNDTIVYGVYIEHPWKISNKETFGNDKTMIFQLSPLQRIFQSNITAKHFMYFNTIGGGIGFGSNVPQIKNNFLRYNPGNVSLTIDSTLEFGVFRHLGLGGEFKSRNPNEVNNEYEDRFLIRDVEVWGCGGEKELQEQNKQWEWEQMEAKRRQQVNLKSIGEDRAILEMAGLVGQHNQSGGSI